MSDATDDRTDDPLLRVQNLEKYYPITGGLLKKKVGEVKAVDGVSFELGRGETLAIVGESGCGKTTLGKTVARLHEPTGGSILFDGQDIGTLSERELKPVRREIQVVYQDPTSSLNPRKRIKDIVAEPMTVHDIGTKAQRRERVVELLRRVDLPEDFRYRYPSELSGGQQQRVAIARALTLNPSLLVLDEPTSALDVSVQAKVISLLEELQDDLGLSYLMITHDLSLTKNIADRIGVMYLGKLMEKAPAASLFDDPQNPYTEQLLSAIPIVEESEAAYKPDRISIQGETPDPSDPPSGCSFHPRCHRTVDECSRTEPELVDVGPDHTSRCVHHDDTD
ncbi:ABC transporter ATP-binding protein [Halobiforma nitratireducens]|uniref:Dipeptide/oligopeptide/nickel ABC transporter ATP-binding protein n=1 Tax=Halobiforma nitratireducens JCM 10879 TaxID=1227454 RepID=M0MRU5_9EURY|nr:oligopeptide/dipeptide ABC transporter ATP-binding protein [Halobiforma nitratireducens]EMA47180.1 dipeptide/oligopeptide/nickel ABC transporter ATP-binding protein [Halobiforma nitratireducens JCM 10879]